jgi:hypothetical protein
MMRSIRIVSVTLRRQRLSTYMHGACQFRADSGFQLDFLASEAKVTWAKALKP